MSEVVYYKKKSETCFASDFFMVKRIIISLIQLPIRMDQLRHRTGCHAACDIVFR